MLNDGMLRHEPCADVAVDRQHDRRTMEGVHELRGDDADDAAMPAVAGDDDAPCASRPRDRSRPIFRAAATISASSCWRRRFSALSCSASSRASSAIASSEASSSRAAMSGRAHAAGGVHARREHEADVIAVDLLAGQAADFEQRPQPDLVRTLRQHAEPELGDDPVLADQRHHVGQRADRRDLDERRQPARAGPLRAERLHQLQRDADAGEVLVRIAAVVPLRIDHGERRGSAVSGS